jgi:DNA adenine methylase
MEKVKISIRTPISYWGGKQRLIPTIVPMVPEHRIYVEPFLGGAAVFFAKPPSKVEVINDTNRELINFYRVCKTRFHELEALIRVTLYSREQHDEARIVYNKPHLFDEIRRAWAVWVLSNQSFSSKLDGTWGTDNLKSSGPLKVTNKKAAFTEELAIRLQNVQIECADAIYIINNRDKEDTFFYCDPPYYNADMGHYDGYTYEDFELLLKTLSGIKGKFLLSSYPSELLTGYIKQFKWQVKAIDMNLTAAGLKKVRTRKTEVLTWNY